MTATILENVSSTTAGTINATISTPIIGGELLVLWIWAGNGPDIIPGVFTLNGRTVSYLATANPMSATAGTYIMKGRLFIVALEAGEQILRFAPATAPGDSGTYFYEYDIIGDDARIGSLYAVTFAVSAAAELLHVPVHTNVTSGLLLAYLWADALPVGAPPGFTLQTAGAFSEFGGSTYGFAWANEPAGVIPQADWDPPPAVITGFGYCLQIYDIALAVDSGKGYTRAGASIPVQHAGGFPLYQSPIGETLYAVPPDPTPIQSPQPPFIERPGEPFRPSN